MTQLLNLFGAFLEMLLVGKVSWLFNTSVCMNCDSYRFGFESKPPLVGLHDAASAVLFADI